MASHPEEQHSSHLSIIFDFLSKRGVTINTKKCELGQASVVFLWYIVSSLGVAPFSD